MDGSETSFVSNHIWLCPASGKPASMLTASQDCLVHRSCVKASCTTVPPHFLLVTSDMSKPSFQVSHENGLENVCLKEVRDFSSSAYCLSAMSRIWQRRIGPTASKAVVHSPPMCDCMFACCVCSGCTNACNLSILADRFAEF